MTFYPGKDDEPTPLPPRPIVTDGKDYNMFLIRTGFKSGNTVEVWVYKYNIEAYGQHVEKVSWTSIADGGPLFINVDEIEFIQQLTCYQGADGDHPSKKD